MAYTVAELWSKMSRNQIKVKGTKTVKRVKVSNCQLSEFRVLQKLSPRKTKEQMHETLSSSRSLKGNILKMSDVSSQTHKLSHRKEHNQ